MKREQKKKIFQPKQSVNIMTTQCKFFFFQAIYVKLVLLAYTQCDRFFDTLSKIRKSMKSCQLPSIDTIDSG